MSQLFYLKSMFEHNNIVYTCNIEMVKYIITTPKYELKIRIREKNEWLSNLIKHEIGTPEEMFNIYYKFINDLINGDLDE